MNAVRQKNVIVDIGGVLWGVTISPTHVVAHGASGEIRTAKHSDVVRVGGIKVWLSLHDYDYDYAREQGGRASLKTP